MPTRQRLQETARAAEAQAHETAHDLAGVAKKTGAALSEKSKDAKGRIERGDWPEGVRMAERGVFWLVEVLQGKVGSNSHPLHPSLIHLPLAFLLASLSLDTFHLAGPYLPLGITSALFSLTGSPHKVTRLNEWSYYLAGAGMLFSLPATTTGLAELYAMTRSRVMEVGWKKFGTGVMQGEEKKVVATLRHAGAMDLVLALVSYTFLERRHYMRNIPDILNTYHTTDFQLKVSAIAFAVLMYGGWKGGDLVYAKGMGVQRQGAAVAEEE
ncbi:hypothetical protein RQP46_010388 [Phenoliferia psychrophenolica]